MSASAQHKSTRSPGHINGYRLRSLARWIIFLPLVAAGVLNTMGCSVYMAANQPSKKDLTVLEQGTPRQAVMAELGTPIWSEDRNEETVEVYKFKQGYTKSVKRIRTVLHAIADVFSFGVWEIPGTLIEKYGLRGTDMAAKVSYDAEGKVRTSELFDATKLDTEPLPRPETIAVVLRPTAPDKLLQIPAKGWLANAGRGAGIGASIGAIPGVLCPLYFIPSCLAGMGGAVLGSVPGAIYGAIAAEPASSWEQAEAAFQAALADLKVQESIRDRVIEIAHGPTSHHINLVIDQDFTVVEIERSYPALDIRGVHKVLELNEVTVELRTSDLAVNPFRKLFLTVWCRLIRTVDGTELDSRVITDEMGGIWSVAEWADQNAEAFRTEVAQAAQRLAQQVVKELFSDTHSSNDVESPASQALSR